MPNRVSSNVSLGPTSSTLESGDDGEAVCAAPPRPTGDSPTRVVDLDPVVVEGDSAQRELVEQFTRSHQGADCSTEKKLAVLSCAGAAAAALGAVASSATVIGAIGGLAATAVASVNCGKDLRALDECEQAR